MKEQYIETLHNNTKIVQHYGAKKQIVIWIEEMSELTKVLCKWARNYDNLEGNINLQLLNDMKEEIADVTISLDQLKYSIGYFEDDLMKEYKYKVDRQLKRIEEEK